MTHPHVRRHTRKQDRSPPSQKGLVAVVVFAITAALVVIAAPAAFAYPIVCNSNAVRYNTSATSTNILFTNQFAYATLTSGGHAERTIGSSTTYQASVTGSASGGVGVNLVIVSAEASVGFSLQVSGTWTDSSAFSTGVNNTTTKTHDYVFFGGTKKGVGTWTKQQCDSDGRAWHNIGSGQWGSWNAQHWGVLRCDEDTSIGNNYGTFSVQYKAVRTC
jgi:hypothetical protein